MQRTERPTYLILVNTAEQGRLNGRYTDKELMDRLGIEQDVNIQYMDPGYFLNQLKMDRIKGVEKVFFPGKLYFTEIKEKLEEKWINYQTIDDQLVK
jgi:hypothetical protein